MTTCPSRSTSPSWWPGSARWPAAPARPYHRSWPAGACAWTPPAGSPPATGGRLDLSPKELAVLELLLAAQGTVVSAEELLEQVWDEAANPFTNTVKMTISRLRAKLGDPPVITTVAQAGYRI